MAYNKSHAQEFYVGGLRYKMTFNDPGSVSLYLMGGYSKKIGDVRKARDEYDPFQKWEDYDPDDFFLMGDEDVGVDVYKLMRECMNRLMGWVKGRRPKYFVISPSTERKEKLYDRIAEKVAKRLKEYNHQKIKNSHYFYRMA